MYLEGAKQAYYSQSTEEVEGCSAEEIAHLEQALHISLPAAYKEFLYWAGHNAGDLFEDTAQYRYSELMRIQESARMIAEARRFSPPLPDDAIVILPYDDMEFHFLRASEGDNPPVYFFFDVLAYQGVKVEKKYYSGPCFSELMPGDVSE